jgi:hypothetical protein
MLHTNQTHQDAGAEVGDQPISHPDAPADQPADAVNIGEDGEGSQQSPGTFLERLDRRQHQVLEDLDRLNARIEQVLERFRRA